MDSRKETEKEAVDKLIKVINKNTDGEFMNYLEKLEYRAQKQGIKLGLEQGAQETARNLLEMGMEIKIVIKATGLEESTVLSLKNEINSKKKR
ncbi:hypothetical protein L3V86_04680 [Thiotrichales bacterium 19S11-10]|nr:hypothetical protein [Thiotrichales bacterium 19S11-10]